MFCVRVCVFVRVFGNGDCVWEVPSGTGIFGHGHNMVSRFTCTGTGYVRMYIVSVIRITRKSKLVV